MGTVLFIPNFEGFVFGVVRPGCGAGVPFVNHLL